MIFAGPIVAKGASVSDSRFLSHPFLPVFDSDSTRLILGSFPSVKAVEEGFYYANPANRFYAVLSGLFGVDFTQANWQQKQALFLQNHIALHDVIGSCRIVGSSDSTIEDVVPANLEFLLNQSSIRHIYCNGQRAYDEYRRFFSRISIPVTLLPSTSPANARMRVPDLIRAWSVLLND